MNESAFIIVISIVLSFLNELSSQTVIFNDQGKTYIDSNGPTSDTYNVDISNCARVGFSFSYSGGGGLETASECNVGEPCQGDPQNPLQGGCFQCWDFLWTNFVIDGDTAYTDLLGVDTNPITSGIVSLSQTECINASSATLSISTQTWAASEFITFSNISIVCWEKENPMIFPQDPCAGDPITLIEIGTQNATEWNWSGPAGSFSGNPWLVTEASDPSVHNGNYTVTVTDAVGCQSTASTGITVEEYFAELVLNGPSEIYNNQCTELKIITDRMSGAYDYVIEFDGQTASDTFSTSEQLINVCYSSQYNNVNYNISTNTIEVQTSGQPSTSINVSLNSIQESDNNQCIGTILSEDINIQLNVHQSIETEIIIFQDTICQNTSTGSFILNYLGTNDNIISIQDEQGNVPPCGETVSTSGSISSDCLPAGTWLVSILDWFIQQARTDTIIIYEYEEPNPQPQILGDDLCIDDPVRLFLDNEYNTVLWNNGSNNDTIEISSEGIYSVIVTNENGCNGFDTIKILPNIVWPDTVRLECGQPYDTSDIDSPIINCTNFELSFTDTEIPLCGTLSAGAKKVIRSFTVNDLINMTAYNYDQIILFTDVTAPVIFCLSSPKIDFKGDSIAILNYQDILVSSIDNCSNELTYSLSQDTFWCNDIDPNLTIPIDVSVSDICGNEAVCQVDGEIVNYPFPDLICPTDIEIVIDAPMTNVGVNYEVELEVNCGLSGQISQTDNSGLTSGDLFPIGSTTQSFMVEDGYGNNSFCQFNIEVSQSPDTLVMIDNADLMINSLYKGIIYKSPDGECWKLTVSNEGEIVSVKVNCP